MTQPGLFDPNTTVDMACPVPGCQAVRFAGQERALTCRHDLDQAAGDVRTPRPRACLNAHDPAHAQFPTGF